MNEIAIRLLKAQDIRLDPNSVTVVPVRGRRHKVSFKTKKGKPQTMILRFTVPPMMAAA